MVGRARGAVVVTETQLNQGTGISAGQSGVTGGISLPQNSAHFTNFEVNGRYLLTPALSLAGGDTYTEAKILGQRPKWQQVNLQTAYSLSKRTDVYLMGNYHHVNHNSLGLNADITLLAA